MLAILFSIVYARGDMLNVKKTSKKFEVIEALDETDPPKPHEKRAAKIIAEYFQSNVKFIRRNIGSSPDIYVIKTRKTWEIKSPLLKIRKLLTYYNSIEYNNSTRR